jgi:hypothetical protein
MTEPRASSDWGSINVNANLWSALAERSVDGALANHHLGSPV